MHLNWNPTTLGALCDSGAASLQTGPFGSQLHSYDYTPVGTRVIPTEGIGRRRILDEGLPRVPPDVVARLSRHVLRTGDIIFARRGVQATGLSALVTSEFAGSLCGTGGILLRVDHSQIDPGYLSFYLAQPSTVDWLKAHAVGAVMPNLNETVLRALPIRLPPFDEQQRVALALLALDDKIELNRQTNETLETMARALFKSWFVDFDPVRAKMEGHLPARMDAGTAALFPDAFSNLELGLSPRGWKSIPLGALFSLDKGVSYKGAFLDNTASPMINLGCFKGDGVFDPGRVKGYAGEVRDAHWVFPGDLLLANTDMTQNRVVLGSPAIVPHHLAQRYLFSHHVFAARFPSGSPNGLPLYCYYALLQPEFRSRAAGFATGTAVLALPRDAVLRLPVVLPPDGLLEVFGKIVAPLRAQSEQNDSESRTLCQLRDHLLPRLLSGELRVREAECVVEAAV